MPVLVGKRIEYVFATDLDSQIVVDLEVGLDIDKNL